jgi:hypothetical protein
MEPFTMAEANGRKEGPAASLHIFLVPASASTFLLSPNNTSLIFFSRLCISLSFLSQEIQTRFFLFVTNISRYVHDCHDRLTLPRYAHLHQPSLARALLEFSS